MAELDPTLGGGRTVHVWRARPADLARRIPDVGPVDLGGELACLDGMERARLGRLRFAADARAFAAAHVLLRRALSTLTTRPPDSWRLDYRPGGRPELAGEPPHGLRLSLSHARGQVACAVARGHAVGVDVERVHDEAVIRDVAERVLSDRELCELSALDGLERRRWFFARWTLKEAYAKALGVGLALPFDRVEFDVARSVGPHDVTLRAAPDDAPDRWTCRHELLEDEGEGEHGLSVCVQRDRSEPTDFVAHRVELD